MRRTLMTLVVLSTVALAEGPPPAECQAVLDAISQVGLQRNQVTVLTPHPDRTIANLEAQAASTIAKISTADPAFRKLISQYVSALKETSAATLEISKVIERNRVPSEALNARMRTAATKEAQAQSRIREHCQG